VERKKEMLAQAARAPRRALIDAVRRFQEAALQPAGSWQPQLPLELAFIELLPDGPLAMASGEWRVAGDELRVTTDERPPTADRRPRLEGRTTDDKPPTADRRPPQQEPATADQRPTVEHDAPPTTRPSPPATLTVPAVAALWPEMTRRVGQHNKNLPALLTMCKPLAIEGRTVILGFDYPLLKDKFDKTAGAADAVVAALRALSNSDCLIRTVTTADYPVPIHKDEFQALATELGGVVRDDE
jgi:DNA polymerase-3 subunit gamma/tau